MLVPPGVLLVRCLSPARKAAIATALIRGRRARSPAGRPRRTTTAAPASSARLSRLRQGRDRYGAACMAKKIVGYIKLQVPAGAANPSPPIGPALGQRGLNIMEFCKAFNARTAQMEKGSPIPVVITAFHDRSFTFEMKLPPVSFFLKKASGVQSGSKTA